MSIPMKPVYFTSTVLSANGRRMTHPKAISKFGILEVLNSLHVGTQPTATDGVRYCDLVAGLLAGKIKTYLENSGIIAPSLPTVGKYPEYKTTPDHYSNPTLNDLYLHGLELGMPEDFYMDCFPSKIPDIHAPARAPRAVSAHKVEAEEEPVVPRTNVRPDPSSRGGAIHRNLTGPRTMGVREQFGITYSQVMVTRTIRSLQELADYCHTPPNVSQADLATRYQLMKFTAGEERYLVIRGANGGITIDRDGKTLPLILTGKKVEKSCWSLDSVVGAIAHSAIHEQDLSLLLAVADLARYNRDGELDNAALGVVGVVLSMQPLD